jgi:FSR family fosmidomycin resistance protein-like MFS transporter
MGRVKSFSTETGRDWSKLRMNETVLDRPTAAPAAEFQTGRVLTIAGGHLIHDIFSSFLAPLLPLIITKLGLSLTLAGSLASLQQLPGLINPLLGMLADRGSLRWLAILSPTITAVTMSLIGIAPTYTVLVILLLTTGFSSAFWHVPTPVMIARVSGRQVGQGMSFFMLGGELARSVGPVIAVGAVSLWGLEGLWRLMPVGLAASAVIYWRLRDVDVRPARRANGAWADSWRELRRVLLPAIGIMLARGFMVAALTTFLPTFLVSEGADLKFAGGALSVLELAGAVGVLTSGTASDRLGRRNVLGVILTVSPLLMLAFLALRGWAMFPLLLVLGFTTLSTNPVLMALVQEYSRDHPATANGLFMASNFAGQALIIFLVGAAADQFGLRATFMACAGIGFAGLPFVLMLPHETTDGRR